MSSRLPLSKRPRRPPGGGSIDDDSKSSSKQIEINSRLLACYSDKRGGHADTAKSSRSVKQN